MITFSFSGAIADIDEVTRGKGNATTKLLILQVGEALECVELPERLFQEIEPKLCAGRVISVEGEIKLTAEQPRKVAASVRFTDPGH